MRLACAGRASHAFTYGKRFAFTPAPLPEKSLLRKSFSGALLARPLLGRGIKGVGQVASPWRRSSAAGGDEEAPLSPPVTALPCRPPLSERVGPPHPVLLISSCRARSLGARACRPSYRAPRPPRFTRRARGECIFPEHTPPAWLPLLGSRRGIAETERVPLPERSLSYPPPRAIPGRKRNARAVLFFGDVPEEQIVLTPVRTAIRNTEKKDKKVRRHKIKMKLK